MNLAIEQIEHLTVPADVMPEAEVAVRLACWLLDRAESSGNAHVAIDGAQVKTKEKIVFPLAQFLLNENWSQTGQTNSKCPWQGTYRKLGRTHELVIHSQSGVGDVVAMVGNLRVRAECKGGTLVRSKSSAEYVKLREALGQVLTAKDIKGNDLLVVAVPSSDKFNSLQQEWQGRSLLMSTGIRIVTVARNGHVRGLEALST